VKPSVEPSICLTLFSMPSHNPLRTMTKRIASLVLVLLLGGSVLAGVPMPSSGGESGMMDCCKKALEQDNSPHVAAARLCCAMNCNKPGPTSNPSSQSFSQTGSEATPLITMALPPTSFERPLRARHTTGTSARSKPSYILNLALLI
jgi:hypothetical protein